MAVIMMKGHYVTTLNIKGRPELFEAVSPCWITDLKSFSPLNISTHGNVLTHERPYVLFIGPCSSSIDVAWHFHENGRMPEWGSLLTPGQWKGKGQFGREWISPEGNIYGAIRLPEFNNDQDGLISLIVAYLMVKGLENLNISARIKWPNDIIVNCKKVGGILIEDRDGVKIAGVGLNLCNHPPVEFLRSQKAIPAGDLSESGCNFKPVQLWHYLMDVARPIFEARIKNSARDTVVDMIRPYMAFNQCRVIIHDSSSGPVEGIVQGISYDGGLELRTENGPEVIHSGSIYPVK